MESLTAKQQRFVAEYLGNGLNATKAYKSAGYAEKNAEVCASQLLRNPKVSLEIGKKSEKALAKIDFSVDRTLEFVARMAFFDPADLFEDDGSMKRIKDISPEARSVIAGLEISDIWDGEGEQKSIVGNIKKIKLSERRGALDMLMRYHALYKDKVEVPGLESLAEALSRARKRTGR